jgi:hypothetical protein
MGEIAQIFVETKTNIQTNTAYKLIKLASLLLSVAFATVERVLENEYNKRN